MNRRQFNKVLGLSALALGANRLGFAHKNVAPKISITMDDFFWQDAIYQTATQRNQAILGALKNHSIKAAMFVIGRNVETDEGKQLLAEWNSAGHLIGNHTYSHQNFNSPSMTLPNYQEDTLRAEAILKSFSRFQKYFRFPMLKEGDTVEKRDGFRSFLKQHDYRVGHVTIDSADWAITPRLQERIKANPSTDVKPYRDFYLAHMWDRAQYYDSLARRVLGRPVKHALLVHFNLLNGLFMNDLIEMFKSKGWEFVDAEDAFTDPVYAAKPNVLPAGESIIWALAKADGTIAKSLKYPAEDGNDVVEQMKKLGL